MALSKKNYVAVAKILKETKHDLKADKETLNTIQSKLADYFKSDNVNFDYTRFNSYIG